MNWKFWQKVPAQPVMSPIETALLKSLKEKPETWSLRHWDHGSSSVRADSPGITILSGVREKYYWFLPIDTHEARCGALEFSKDFAGAWHVNVSARLCKKEAEETRTAADAIKSQLTRILEI